MAIIVTAVNIISLVLPKVKVKMVNLTTIAKDRKGVLLETNE